MVTYSVDLILPANTPERSAVEVIIPVYAGFLENVAVLFPDGCAQLARVALFDRDSRLVPGSSSPTPWLTGDNETIKAQVGRKVSGPPYLLKLRGWNEDDTYPHIPTIRIEMAVGRG